MDKITAEVPGMGAFEMQTAKARRASEADLYSYVWQAAVERRVEPPRFYRDGGKRALDVLLVLLALPFALPLIGLCALALWHEGGKPFYTQERLGRFGQRFRILKLRTMVPDAAAALSRHLAENPAAREEWNRYQKLQDDPRVTPVGRFLRTTSIDELPQLLNVLTGEMSLIGPRPMMPEQLGLYGDATAYCALRPGITGLWQVSARNSESFSYRKQVDAAYERDLTAGLDLGILVRTVGVVLRQTGS
ncbi:MAG: sugar transferase [Sulfitobacter sp.]|nr:sugar transferase [Sulfitobacter sp.]